MEILILQLDENANFHFANSFRGFAFAKECDASTVDSLHSFTFRYVVWSTSLKNTVAKAWGLI